MKRMDMSVVTILNMFSFSLSVREVDYGSDTQPHAPDEIYGEICGDNR